MAALEMFSLRAPSIRSVGCSAFLRDTVPHVVEPVIGAMRQGGYSLPQLGTGFDLCLSKCTRDLAVTVSVRSLVFVSHLWMHHCSGHSKD